MTERVCLASVSCSMPSNALMPAGLTAYRSNLAHDRRKPSSPARLGAKKSALGAPVPQVFSAQSRNASNTLTGNPSG